jgi:hypothetical protein
MATCEKRLKLYGILFPPSLEALSHKFSSEYKQFAEVQGTLSKALSTLRQGCDQTTAPTFLLRTFFLISVAAGCVDTIFSLNQSSKCFFNFGWLSLI